MRDFFGLFSPVWSLLFWSCFSNPILSHNNVTGQEIARIFFSYFYSMYIRFYVIGEAVESYPEGSLPPGAVLCPYATLLVTIRQYYSII